MIDIKRWRDMGRFFADREEFNGFIYGAADEDIQAKVDSLKQNEFPVLVGILPTIIGTGMNFDILGHQSPLFFYCMVPLTNMNAEDTDEAWEKTLGGAKAIEQCIKAYCNDTAWREFYLIRPETIHIDPEYNMWGLMGWSIGFEIEHAN